MAKQVWLSGGKGAGKFAVVDDADYDLVSSRLWQLNADGYAMGYVGYDKVKKRGITKLMHRFIMNAPDGTQVDHIDGDRLNNQRSNLRFCDTRLNNRNMRPGARKGTSQYKGVAYDRSRSKWMAMVKDENRRYNLGRFTTEIEAARAYDRKAKELFGEFFRPNLPEEQ
jgi:AP2 domain/HNH endonuclease